MNALQHLSKLLKGHFDRTGSSDITASSIAVYIDKALNMEKKDAEKEWEFEKQQANREPTDKRMKNMGKAM